MNKTFLSKEGIIYVLYEGDQTYDTLKWLVDTTQKTADELINKSKPIIAIIDHTKIGKLPPPAQWSVVIKALKTSRYDKVAIVVKNKIIKYIAKLVIMGINKESKFSFFASQADAKKWLLKNQDEHPTDGIKHNSP